jgi:alkylhydroperoxidase family enzyme
MIRRLILKRLDKEERALGESVEYVRHILRTSLPAFFKFALFTPLSQHRRKLAAAPYRVACLVATRDEDCGTCVQIEVNLALKEGVPPEVIHAVLNDRPDELAPELAEVYRFAKSVVEATGGEDELREKIRERYGEDGLVELAFGIASSRVFPVTKRALGYAKSCALVDVKVKH